MSYPNHPNNPRGISCPYDIAELLTPENIARYRASFDIETPGDLARVTTFYSALVEVHNEGLDLDGPLDLDTLLEGTDAAITMLQAILNPTAQDLFESEADLVEPEIPA